MRVLAIYSAATLPASQALFAALGSQPAVELAVLTPARWYNPFRGQAVKATAQQFAAYQQRTGELLRPQRGGAGLYRSGLAAALRRVQPDLIHLFGEPFSHQALQMVLYRRLFAPQARCLAMGIDNLIPAARGRLQRGRRALAQRELAAVTCWSQSAQAALIGAGFAKERLPIMGWNVPLELFTPARNEALRQARGWEGQVVIGYIGRLVAEKGLDDLIAALAMLPPRYVALIVGAGPDAARLDAAAAAAGLGARWQRVGRVADRAVVPLMQACDLLVLPSRTTPTWKEQFGRVLIEAMACGLPVVGSDSGAIPEVIGEGGLVFAEGDAAALAAALQRLGDDPAQRAQVAARGRERARRFSSDVVAERLAAIYHATAYATIGAQQGNREQP